MGGIILYELVCGKLPFGTNEQAPVEVFKAVRKNELTFPSGYDHKYGRNLIESLLCKKPRQRIGSTYGCREISEHDFFEDGSTNLFLKLLNREYVAPYVPYECVPLDKDAVAGFSCPKLRCSQART